MTSWTLRSDQHHQEFPAQELEKPPLLQPYKTLPVPVGWDPPHHSLPASSTSFPPLPKLTTTQFTASLKSPRELLFCSYTHEKKQPDSFTVGHRWGCYMVLVTIHTSTAALSRNSQMSVWKDWAWLKIQASDGWSTQSQGLWHSKEGFPVNQVAQFKVQCSLNHLSKIFCISWWSCVPKPKFSLETDFTE